MSLNYDELFRQMAGTPQVREALNAKAKKVQKYLRLRWPEVENLPDRDRAFLEGDKENVVTITEIRERKRPVAVVTVRHPGAVAKQAKSGFVTTAVNDAQ